MYLATLLASTTAIAYVGAAPALQTLEARDIDISLDLGNLVNGFDLTSANHYGSPLPPWIPGSKPGWYYGPHPEDHSDLPCLGGLICQTLDLMPNVLHCPAQLADTPPLSGDGYAPTFLNLTGAIEADGFLTFGLVETVADCKTMCDTVQGCNFVNSYHDVNGKDGSPLLTCSLYMGCHGPADANNRGGQTQPNGSIDFITDSDGYCWGCG